MIRKYKIGNIAIEVNAHNFFDESEPYSRFIYNGDKIDYHVNIDFTSDFPLQEGTPCCELQDKICFSDEGKTYCYFLSQDDNKQYYAYREKKEKNIDILIDEKYRNMLWSRVIFTLLGIEELIAENNGCVLHASFVEKNGKAVLFVGPCTIGKSTQANLWKEYAQATVINGDKAFIFEENGAYYASGIPYSGSSKDCLNKVLPLDAIICLDKATLNTATRLSGKEAFCRLYKNCYPVAYSRICTDKLLDFVLELSQNVVVYDYACLADESAVRFLERELCRALENL